jgi:hypothetical protein
MAINSKNKIVTNGLVYYVDFANPACYASGSGYLGSVSKFADLSRFNGDRVTTGSLYAGATYDPSVGGCISFDGTNDHAILSNTKSYSNLYAWASVTSSETPISNTSEYPISTELTVDFWVYTTGDAAGYILSKPWDGGGRYNWWVNTTGQFRIAHYPNTGSSATTTVTPSPLLTNAVWRNRWVHCVYWVNQTNLGYYFNADQQYASTTNALQTVAHGTYNIRINVTLGNIFPYGNAWGGSTANAAECKIAQLRIYNRVLSHSEVRQNFAATRGKFGV